MPDTERDMMVVWHKLMQLLDELAQVVESSSSQAGEPIALGSSLSRRLVAGARTAIGALSDEYANMTKFDRECVDYDAEFSEASLRLSRILGAIRTADENAQSRLLSGDEQIAAAMALRRIVSRYAARSQRLMSKTDAELLLCLSKKTNQTYEQRFARAYGVDRKPFVDRLYRDFMYRGFPNTTLKMVDAIVNTRSYDYILCILRGGLPYAVMLEAMGWPQRRIKYIGIGRSDARFLGSPELLRQFYNSGLEDLVGKNVLLVDNVISTGGTISRVLSELTVAPPQAIGLLVDRVEDLSDMGLQDGILVRKWIRERFVELRECGLNATDSQACIEQLKVRLRIGLEVPSAVNTD